MANLSGKQIGPYQLQTKLGQGAFGSVYVAKKNNGKTYCAKVVSLSNTKSVVREIEAMLILGHPNVVKLHDVYDTSANVYIIMQYCAGGTLHDLILDGKKKGKRMNEDYLQMILEQLVDALGYIHSENILHRDLKPANILFKDKSMDHIVIADFGISRQHESNMSLAGTMGFMAPEVAAGATKYDTKADVYSLGKVILACATLNPHPVNSDIPSYLSASLRDLLSHMLQLDRSKRYVLSRVKVHPFLQ